MMPHFNSVGAVLRTLWWWHRCGLFFSC